MTDATSAGTPRTPDDGIVEDAVIVDEATGEAVEVETVHATETEPVVATIDAGAVATEPPVAPAQQIVYVRTPEAPKKAGNRGIGSLLAIASAVIYAIAFAVVVVVILGVQFGRSSLTFIAQPEFYVPVLFYVIGLVLLVLILNRAGWAAYVVGSLLVGVFVYFGTIGVLVLGRGIVLMTPVEAAALFNAALRDPFVIAAALVAREVSLWIGALISRRGRRLKVRNAEARAAYDRDLAESRAERERANAAPATV